MRIKQNADLAVRVVNDGDPVVGTVIKKEINIWDKYNLSSNDLAKKISLTGPRTNALIWKLNIKQDPECFKQLNKKSIKLLGYSKKALDRLREAIKSGVDIDSVWQEYRQFVRARKSHE